jgi:hypothetical protein
MSETITAYKGFLHKVDGKTVKPDTLYTLKDGKFVAAEAADAKEAV